ncbi:MAG: glutamyl-tRNA reductase, partial [Myxococcaceae bacterium]
MELLCLGISYKTAPVGVRERLALTTEQQAEALSALARVGEVMLVSTCNRVEFYVASEEPQLAREALLGTVTAFGGAEAANHLYEQRADSALVHLFRVSSSLDSMVLGEAQILGQVKDAFELAQKHGTMKGELARACQAAFAAAKRVRSETAIGRSATSMASAAVEMATKIFGSVKGRAALVVGAGEISELSARHLLAAGAKRVIIANRTF